MQSLSKYSNGTKNVLCAINQFSKYAWVVPIIDRKGTSIVNAFNKITSKKKKVKRSLKNKENQIKYG